MKIYVLAPYSKEIIEALEVFSNVVDVKVELIGNEENMNTMFIKNNDRFNIINIKTEDEIISYCKEFIEKDSFIIIGDISEYSQKKLFNMSIDSEFGTVNVLNFPGCDSYYYVSSFSKKKRYYYEDKKTSIVNAYKFMKGLEIKKINVGLVKSQISKSDELETNIIRMLESDRKCNSLHVLDPIYVRDIFDNKLNINLLVFDNYDITKVFIDAIKMVTYTKVACINYYNDCNSSDCKNFFICCDDKYSKQEILFSILMLYNVRKYSKSKEKISA